MKRWFISDTHFSHTNIIRYTGRPFHSVEEMNATLIQNWNDSIDSQDTVFFLGDFGIGTTEQLKTLCSQLHGHKISIRGNHDGTPAKMHQIEFSLVLESAFIKVGRHPVELVHIPSPSTHFQLHGHVHEKRPNKLINHQLNLSVEVWDYKPVSEKTINSLLDKNTIRNELTKEAQKLNLGY